MSKKSLYPQQELIISPKEIVIGSLIFWLVFFIIGGITRYYPLIGA